MKAVAGPHAHAWRFDVFCEPRPSGSGRNRCYRYVKDKSLVSGDAEKFVPFEEPICLAKHAKIAKKTRKLRNLLEASRKHLGSPFNLLAFSRRAAGRSSGNMLASFQSPFFYTQPDIARVNIAMEIATESVKFEKMKGKNHAGIDILGVAYLPDGSVGARFSDTLNFDFDDKHKLAVERFKARPTHYETEFQAAPGKYNLKVVFNSGGDSFGKLEGPLEIEPFNNKDLALSALALSREAHPAGEVLDLSLLSDVTPLLAEGMRIVPTGSNRFNKAENRYSTSRSTNPIWRRRSRTLRSSSNWCSRTARAWRRRPIPG